MTELIFFSSLFLIFYIYAGYPLLAFIIGALLDRRVQSADSEPLVSILIAAYNEETCIEATVRNKLSLDYPVDKLEVIVISDGSSDKTEQIVESIHDPRVRLVRQSPRAGKTSALNKGVLQASGEIIVFSDANSLYAPDALRRLVANFTDQQVGYVSGKMIYANPDGTPIGEGCGAYMKYENALRSIETRIGSIVGVDGGIDAVRKKLYRPLNADQLPDFVQPLKIVEQGYRVIYEPGALLWEHSLEDSVDEYRMRVRVSLRALWALFDMKQLLCPGTNTLFAWQLWSHKVLRYLCFVFMACAFIANALLVGSSQFYFVLFTVQIACYLMALFAPYLERIGITGMVLSFSRYYLLLNVAAAHAFFKFIFGKKQVIWTPRKG